MPNDGQIVFEVTADGSRAKVDIRDITKTIQQETDKWDDAAQESANNINNSFSGMLKKLAVGFSAAKIGKELLDLGKQAISAASDLAEVQNVVDTTFGAEGAAKIEQWAKAAGTQFGLTETQAKKFTSTLGAMMKSSGIAGEEIVSMSTDLAGLAADMASFYNLDFDEAFQKIRSGISGETEPLKQLGINMSVANLNAYALQKGLSKTFEQMDQGEQTMLRYQYIMSATADAQGDFAKTSDQYANGVRSLETNIETLKTNVGTLLLEVINPLVQGINSLFPQENTKRHTVLDDIAEVQLQTEAKLEEIKAIKSVADELISTLESIGSDKNASGQLSSLAESANKLKASSKKNWESLLSSLQGIDGLQNLFGNGTNAVGTVEDLASALSGESVTMSRAAAWDIFLSALSDNADTISSITGESVANTKEWLKGIADQASKISPTDAQAWDDLLTTFNEKFGFTINSETSGALTTFATGVNSLDSSSPANWKNVLGSLRQINGLQNLFGEGSNAEDKISELASALSGESVTMSRAAAWDTFLSALSDNADAITSITGESVTDTKEWLKGIAEQAKQISPTDAQAWDDLLTAFNNKLGFTINSETSGALSTFAASVNSLDSNSPENWENVLGSLSEINGLQNLFGEGSNAEDKISSLAGALSGNGVSMTKARAWKTFLGALSDNSDAVSQLTGQSAGETKKWLEDMATAAGQLDESDASAWQMLMNSLLSGLSIGQTDDGKQFIDLLAENFLAMGKDSEAAVAGLSALWFTTDEIQSKQMQWLEVCKQLVNTIPGLSDIIDTNTGEVKGGVPAIKAYADEWERVQEYQAKIESLSKKKKIFEDITDPSELGATAMSYRAVAKGRAQASQDSETVERKLNKLKGYMTKLAQGEAYIKGVELEGQDTFDEFIALAKGASGALSGMGSMAQETYRTDYGWDVLEWFSNLDDKTQKAVEDYLKAEFDYQDALFYRPLALKEYEDSLESLAAEYNMTTQQLEDAINAENASAESMTKVEKAAKGDAEALTDVETAVNNVSDAFKELADYAENSYNNALKAVDGVAKSLDRVSYQSFGNMYKKLNDLTTKQSEFTEGSDEWKQYQSEIDKLNQELVTTDTIISNLGTQSQFLDDYLENLRIAQSWGLSDALLAQLSDGSVESAQYLSALVGFGTEQDQKAAEEIDKQYQEIQKKKEELAQALGNQQLTVDQVFQNLAEKAKQAVEELDLQQSAETNAEKTVLGVVSGVSSQLPAVQTAVDNILAQIGRLGALGWGLGFGTIGDITNLTQAVGSVSSWFAGIPGFESGLDIVPIDNMLARLHKGEAVLTAEENRVWQSFRSGLTAGVDMETLGGVMRDNVKAGGNVYLDGRVVGSVISDQQGRSYRQLQRSGWQG